MVRTFGIAMLFIATTIGETLADALRRASNSFHNKQVWRKLQLNGMSTDVSWRIRASQYATLFHDVVTARRNRAH